MFAYVITVLVIAAFGLLGSCMTFMVVTTDEAREQTFGVGVFSLGLLIASIKALSWV